MYVLKPEKLWVSMKSGFSYQMNPEYAQIWHIRGFASTTKNAIAANDIPE
jgi:hypothetical protein